MSLKNQTFWGEGVAFAGGRELFEVQNLGLTFGVETIEAIKGDGGGKIIIPVGSVITARVEFLGMNAENFEILTGAAATAGTVNRIREEAVTKSTNTLTLANTPVANSERVVASGASKVPLKRVAATPAVGEYTISGDTITLNASQSEDDFLVSYFYADGANGLTSQFGPSTLPSSFELQGAVRTLQAFSDSKKDIIFKAAKCERTSELNFGAANRQFGNPGFDANVRVDTLGDLELYWPE